MFSAPAPGRMILIFIAIGIIVISLFLSNYISDRIAEEEAIRIQHWTEALRETADPNSMQTILTTRILTEGNNEIPAILTNENDSIIDFYNLDSAKVLRNPNYLPQQLQKLKSHRLPIEWVNPADTTQRNLIYYGDSRLSNLIKYFPVAQLIVGALFVALAIFTIQVSNRSTQNQLWAGMAKEAAHQLGTPITSLEGWVEILKDSPQTHKMAGEISKDVSRLKLVSDRFGKIGSKPHLEESNILVHINEMVDYIKRRAPGKVSFVVNTNGEREVFAMINPPLFDWVIENLLKNALDAMNERGTITVDVRNNPQTAVIDITDTGKGMAKKLASTIFKPGITTKKRGWGLGLTLSKRIVEEYHGGEIYVKNTDLAKGTTFRVVLKR